MLESNLHSFVSLFLCSSSPLLIPFPPSLIACLPLHHSVFFSPRKCPTLFRYIQKQHIPLRLHKVALLPLSYSLCSDPSVSVFLFSFPSLSIDSSGLKAFRCPPISSGVMTLSSFPSAISSQDSSILLPCHFPLFSQLILSLVFILYILFYPQCYLPSIPVWPVAPWPRQHLSPYQVPRENKYSPCI